MVRNKFVAKVIFVEKRRLIAVLVGYSQKFSILTSLSSVANLEFLVFTYC